MKQCSWYCATGATGNATRQGVLPCKGSTPGGQSIEASQEQLPDNGTCCIIGWVFLGGRIGHNDPFCLVKTPKPMQLSRPTPYKSRSPIQRKRRPWGFLVALEKFLAVSQSVCFYDTGLSHLSFPRTG
jgi:hypothetical protein